MRVYITSNISLVFIFVCLYRKKPPRLKRDFFLGDVNGDAKIVANGIIIIIILFLFVFFFKYFDRFVEKSKTKKKKKPKLAFIAAR